jgi:hypothetical protein
MDDAKLIIGNVFSKENIESIFHTSFGARIKGITLRRTLSGEPYIIIFTRENGPYRNRGEIGKSIYYDGEGQGKDQELTPGNKALISASKIGRRIYGFRQDASGSGWRYLGPLEVVNYTYLPKNNYKTYEFQFSPTTAINKTTALSVSAPRVDMYLLDKEYTSWKKLIESEDGHRFTSFSQSRYLQDQEDYKKDLNRKANEVLAVAQWEHSQIGTGEILRKVVKAIELKENNLVFTSSYARTRQGAPHSVLLGALEENKTAELEQSLFNIYTDQIVDEDGFNEMVEQIGKRYNLIAYLFFIKNPRKYMPIAPDNFDRIFNQLLGIQFKTSHQCSWENYENYNGVIQQVAKFLSEELDEAVALIDAHSFLWIIGAQATTRNESEAALGHIVAQEVYVDTSYVFDQRKNNDVVRASTPLSISESNHRNAVRGDQGEHIVLDYEKQQLREAGRPDLADMVRRVSEDNSSLGYDILSYTVLGEMKYIEVKTTTFSSVNKLSFLITPNEYKTCKTHINYMLYVVCDIDKEVNIKYIRNPFNGIDSLFGATILPGGMAEPTKMRITFELDRK